MSRLDLGLSNIVYERMRTAISHLKNDPAVQAKHPDYILQGTHLRSIFLKSFSPSPERAHTPKSLQSPDEMRYLPHDMLDHPSRISVEHEGIFRDDMRIQSWAKRHSRPHPVKVEGDPDLSLNATQIRAIAMMIGERMSLVQGVSVEFQNVSHISSTASIATWDWEDQDHRRGRQASQGS
jgi:hypothetical protein